MNTPAERLAALRTRMPQLGIDLYLVPSADEHVNEYLPPWRARREWLSGFSGSAGDLLVGREEAWLFVDGRYHLQADSELAGSGIAAVKVGASGAPTLVEKLKQLAEGAPAPALGFDPHALSLGMYDALSGSGLRQVEVEENLVDVLWSERPEPATAALREIPEEWSGSSPMEKVQRVRAELANAKVDALLALKLDQIAWLLDLRSTSDVPYNPVFESFLWLDERELHLFVREPALRLPLGYASRLPELAVHDYGAWRAFLATRGGQKVRVDPSGATRGVVAALERAGASISRGDSPIEILKAKKNAAEQAAMRRANLLASVAVTKALLWLRRECARGVQLTERRFAQELERLYAQQEDYWGQSFGTIAGAGENGAIIHYGAAGERPIGRGELFLIDSGAHLAGGTTDATRTMAIGAADEEQRRAYTAVLRGHIDSAAQRFPAGTGGQALDTLARASLWNELLDYAHGTGHGVGALLNVHEGPFSISAGRNASSRPLEPGHVTSIEPGYYRAGWGGIRLENLYLVRQVGDAPVAEGEKRWLELESLTWIPFDENLIDRERLSTSQRHWLDLYQRECVERLGTRLDPGERRELASWLAERP
ncbi:MAG: aminopeptidase P family protein [Planctomycetes bacterium]|nr:aminopeptidase P family protein [Planctomycetota bacterium]